MEKSIYITPVTEMLSVTNEASLLNQSQENNVPPSESDAKKFNFDPIGDDFFNVDWNYEEEEEE